jgi:hypothetical protein
MWNNDLREKNNRRNSLENEVLTGEFESYFPHWRQSEDFAVRSFDAHGLDGCCFRARYDIALIADRWPPAHPAGRLA